MPCIIIIIETEKQFNDIPIIIVDCSHAPRHSVAIINGVWV